MVLYLIYRNPKPTVKEECKDPELGVANLSKISATEKGSEVHPINLKSPSLSSDEEVSKEEEQNNNDHDNKEGNENIEV